MNKIISLFVILIFGLLICCTNTEIGVPWEDFPDTSQPGKLNYINKFDQVIACNPDSEAYDYKAIIKSNILSDEDNNVILDFCEKEKYYADLTNAYLFPDSYTKRENVYFDIGIGIINNSEYVFIYIVSSYYYRYSVYYGKDVKKSYLFESNLDYSFDEIILEFENMIGESITNEMLDSYENGITLKFKTIDNNTYQVYYTMDYNGITYTLEL